MKFKFMSDLHLESCPSYRPEIYDGDDQLTLVLAGDVCEIRKKHILLPFLEDMSARFKNVVYVPGNHEYYNGHLTISESKLLEAIAHLPNVHFINNKTVHLDGVNFIGCTLWTSMNNGNPLDVWAVGNGLNDYRKIRYSNYSRIKPAVTMGLHAHSVHFIRNELERLKNQVNVVVTHHAPCTLSINDKYKGDNLNAGYVTDLTNIMADFVPEIWIHGHMHDSFDYTVYETRVLCNPKGYPLPRYYGYSGYENADFNDNLVIQM